LSLNFFGVLSRLGDIKEFFMTSSVPEKNVEVSTVNLPF